MEIVIPQAEAIVLFALVYRFCETRTLQLHHPAEAIVLDDVAALLECQLAEPYQVTYSEALAAARKQIVTRYQMRMGKYSNWLNDVPHQEATP